MSINKSKAYIVPLLSLYVELSFINKITNSYLFLESDLNEYIIVEYSNSNDEDFQCYIHRLSDDPHCLSVYHKEDKIYFVFVVVDLIAEDYKQFTVGKYSKISNKHKEKIVSFSIQNYGKTNFEVISRLKQTLYKDIRLRKQLEESLDVVLPDDSELSSVPDLSNETLKI